MAELSDSWQHFERELAGKLEIAEGMGMSDARITDATKHVADWLTQEKSPRMPEEVLLKHMWQSADDRERQAMSSVLHKMIERRHLQ